MLEPVIGLEIHLALSTSSKLFCSCSADGFGVDPNTHVCPVCLGLPGSLPVTNRAALDKAIMLSLALGCSVPSWTQFHRKNYYYPDAPKNYQISQLDRPVGSQGHLMLANGRRIGITRCHLEEDAGRSVHPPYADHSLVDFNRAGAPLVEMVTEPDLRSPDEAREFLVAVRAIARALGVSDASPEEGKMRADVNVSLREPDGAFGTKVEVKNLNSFKSVQAALAFEIKRQTVLLEDGFGVDQETRGWNEGGQKTYSLRSKEEASDYRYFPDPDLPTIPIGDDWLARIRAETPELPAAKRDRYLALGVREADADLIALDVASAHFFDGAIERSEGRDGADPQTLANWLNSEIAGHLNAEGRTIDELELDPAGLVELVALVGAGTISGKTAKELLPEVLDGADPARIVEERGLKQLDDEDAVAGLVEQVLEAHPDIVDSARENPKAINALLGRVMQASRGKANPELVRRLLDARVLGTGTDPD